MPFAMLSTCRAPNELSVPSLVKYLFLGFVAALSSMACIVPSKSLSRPWCQFNIQIMSSMQPCGSTHILMCRWGVGHRAKDGIYNNADDAIAVVMCIHSLLSALNSPLIRWS